MSESAGRILMIPKGTYSPTTTYDPLDAVKYGHNSYVCKQTSRGNLPTNTTYWQPLTDVTADENPTEDSTNLVQSGGVYSALRTIKQTLTNYVNNDIYYDGAKNLLPLLISKIKAINTTGSWSKSDENDVYTISGVTYTITSNANGVITNIKASGTGASSSPFSDLVITLRNTNDAFAMYELIKNNTLTVATHAGNSVNFILDGQYNGSWKTVQAISGKADITLDISTSNNVQTCIRIVSGITVTNEDITPIMAQKSLMDIDDSFSPYAKTNQQLTQDSVTWDDLSEVGAVNYCKNKASSTTTTDGTTTFTWTVNDDKSVTVSAPSYPVTTARTIGIEVWNNITPAECKILVGKTFILSGCPSGGNGSYELQAYRVKSDDGSSGTVQDFGDGVAFTWLNNGSGTQKAKIVIQVKGHATLTGPLTFKPMIAPVSYNGPYVPYAKSNRELTDDVESARLLQDAVTQHITVTADGTKTVQTLMNELHTALASIISTLDSSETLHVIGARSDGGTWFRPSNVELKYASNNTLGNVSMDSFTVTTGQNCYIYSVTFSSTLATNTFRQMNVLTSGNTFTDRTNDVPTSGTQWIMTYQIYKTV